MGTVCLRPYRLRQVFSRKVSRFEIRGSFLGGRRCTIRGITLDHLENDDANITCSFIPKPI